MSSYYCIIATLQMYLYNCTNQQPQQKMVLYDFHYIFYDAKTKFYE